MARLPDDAFAQYVALGPERSYDALAKRLRAGKRSITRLAAKEKWRERLAKIEEQARARLDDKLTDTLQEINARHVKIVRAIQAKALQALQSLALTSGMDAVRALDIAIKHERLIFGEPSERTAVDVEAVCRDEHQRWMQTPGDASEQTWDTLDSPDDEKDADEAAE
jgi:vacuolar-type H+-ATPase subunit H